MAKINKRTLAKRQRDIEDNQLLSKLLFQELPQLEVTPDSQLYFLRREVRGDGVVLIPIRAPLEVIAALTANFFDEGNEGTQYLPNQIYDELDENATYLPEEFLDENGA